jgi:hypothetical protein
MELLKRICEGFVYAGWNVFAQETQDVESNDLLCIVCRCKCRKNLIGIVVDSDGNAWRFIRIHAECLPWTDQERAGWITRPLDPLTPHKGLTMICRAIALGGGVVYMAPSDQPPMCVCFVCKKQLNGKYIKFTLHETIVCAQTHEACAEPFKAERDRAIVASERVRAWKIWALSPFLGDCRHIIGGFLAQMPIHEDVFNLMYPHFFVPFITVRPTEN